MPSSLLPSRYQQNDASATYFLPLVLLLSSVVSSIGTSVAHALLTSAVAWTVLSVYTSVRLRRGRNGKEENGVNRQARRLSWAAGGLLALARICERAVDGRGIWWANGLLPLTLTIFLSTSILPPLNEPTSPPASPEKSRPNASYPTSPNTSLIILTASAVAAIFAALGSNATIALGLSDALVTSLAFLLVERAHSEAKHGNSGGSVIYAANGLLAQPAAGSGGSGDAKTAVMRDVAVGSAVCTTVAALTLESFSFGGLGYWGVFGQVLGDNWMFWDGVLGVAYAVGMIQRQGSLVASFVPLAASICSQMLVDFSLSRVWFAVLCAVSTYTFFDEQETFSAGSGRTLRPTRILTLVAVISFGVLAVLSLRQPYEAYRFRTPADSTQGTGESDTRPPPTSFAPLEFTNSRVHPIDQLVRDAEVEWMKVVQGQSQSLEQAVAEYRRRYQIPPPPNFDKWYEFAKRKGVQLIDEYDTIYHSLRPFWALQPETIRTRAQEAIGNNDNFLMGLLIRDGTAKYVENGQDWLQQAVVGMIEQFVKYLPDMDIAFNTHDEPRVVVPHDDLTRLVKEATNKFMPAAFANPHPRNSFSPRPNDLTIGTRIPEAKTTRFNVYAHQPVWIPSRLSCPPDSPARALDEGLAGDNLTAYALTELGFVYNATAFSDVCNSPSFAGSHGFFERPNAFNVVHDLFPIFSQSKMSAFQDILYPSPWYWYGKVDYVERQDLDWKNKIHSMLWRGSTTGGFSRNGGWRRQHRQQMVKHLNALDNAKVLENINKDPGRDENTPEWKLKTVPRSDYKEVMDVHFSHIGQCDPGDCDAMKEYFGITEGVDQQDHWKWKYLLDMDGNAFSGRFYAFLKSKSLVFKMAVFREWHADWLKPWVHFIPLSLRGDEALEAVRYFSGEPDGKRDAVRLAEQGREWAAKALRNEDFEVWFFRLLLEYGRLVDDARAEIGYAGS
ncbi:uncharacterized protein LTR77_008635 [Saxophila tyrrhenica]|uniref:Glycosyl transferase CAP10 domain-containing protein n=1 Tax=Saxophila tyrrhenica TaxID=1690608 RepID=A0AAV9P069_9PEZI|nr:hypothetical protein LTR77_008635 [Saxophila tyrrhenica]